MTIFHLYWIQQSKNIKKMNNEKMFDYAFNSMSVSGGDGNTLILLKQQIVENVAAEFEDWAKEKWPSVEKKMTNGGILFYEEQESILFTQWKDFDKYQRSDEHQIPLGRGDYLCIDNIIVTW